MTSQPSSEEFPGRPTAFEDLVEDYDAARPTYPPALFDALGRLGDCLELGAGTGIASTGLAERSRLVVTDLGPRMLAKGLPKHGRPGVVCQAEALPFGDGSFDTVCGAQMWHWTSDPAGAEVRRVLRPDGRLLLWWNEVQADGLAWFDRQQDRLEAGNPVYRRGYREVDYAARLLPWFVPDPVVQVPWTRSLTPELYARWLRSKSYVQALADVEGFVAASLADLAEAFPDGVIVEPFVTRLFRLRRRP